VSAKGRLRRANVERVLKAIEDADRAIDAALQFARKGSGLRVHLQDAGSSIDLAASFVQVAPRSSVRKHSR
jgi:hypothetical protein